MDAKPVACLWDGSAFRPVGPSARLCGEQFAAGRVYRLAQVTERSKRSHDHFFVEVEEAWKNLPERFAGKFATADDLRKHALIHTGWHNPPQHYVCMTREEAHALVGHLSREQTGYVEFAIDDAIVTKLTARSQSYAAMPAKKDFQQSKTDVLEYLTALLGVSLRELSDQARGATGPMRRPKEVA